MRIVATAILPLLLAVQGCADATTAGTGPVSDGQQSCADGADCDRDRDQMQDRDQDRDGDGDHDGAGGGGRS